MPNCLKSAVNNGALARSLQLYSTLLKTTPNGTLKVKGIKSILLTMMLRLGLNGNHFLIQQYLSRYIRIHIFPRFWISFSINAKK